MVLTGAQTTAFFEGADQMAIPNATVLQLVAEGIETEQQARSVKELGCRQGQGYLFTDNRSFKS